MKKMIIIGLMAMVGTMSLKCSFSGPKLIDDVNSFNELLSKNPTLTYYLGIGNKAETIDEKDNENGLVRYLLTNSSCSSCESYYYDNLKVAVGLNRESTQWVLADECARSLGLPISMSRKDADLYVHKWWPRKNKVKYFPWRVKNYFSKKTTSELVALAVGCVAVVYLLRNVIK